jgi:hypothetical protein
MTRNRSWCLAAGIVLAGLGAFVIAAGSYYYYKYVTPRLLEEKRVAVGPPNIMANTPGAGEVIPADSPLVAEATVYGSSPIARAEVWVDGELA